MSFKNLNLRLSDLDSCISEYCKEQNIRYELKNQSTSKKYYEISRSGQEPAKLTVHLNNKGTTTLQHSQGKNPELSLQVAEHIRSKLCELEISSLNMAIAGIDETLIVLIREQIEAVRESNNIIIKEIEINGGVQLVLESQFYQDKLTISYYKNTKRLQIQGKPLSCYKEVAYALTTELDLDTLSRILYKKDEADGNTIRPEMAIESVKNNLPHAYDKLPKLIQDLLVSSNCIKSASPELLEYSLLTYAELRSLEGVIKTHLSENGIVQQPRNVGEIFKLDNRKKAIGLSENYENLYSGNKMSEVLKAYSYYYQRRHSLFHIEQFAESTSTVTTLDGAINICNKVYNLIEDIYN
ncbi:type II toxin-antitoxin system RnlA family toxin [Psychrobacter sp. UBA2769]|uniref:type II toxin-antitoxin system RnlA family toxin n=1 Tax=Psychrobacter sp. UBA2769 TaxID=1947348 RepID=UPI0025DDBD67|nr:type II toxin-antitoxin system RnlA family toxin [Psychrobacter sp. UBA2769]